MRRGHQQPGAHRRSVPPVPRLGSENGFAAAVSLGWGMNSQRGFCLLTFFGSMDVNGQGIR